MQKNNTNRWKSKTTKSASGWSGGGNYGKNYTSGTNKGKTASCKVSGYARTTGIARGYNQVCCTFESRYKYYRMLWDQTRGACRGTRPTPATLKSFANWVNKGANIWKVTNTQINKWCNTKQTFKTCASAKTALCNKFGKTAIKAITYDKSGGYLVVTPPNYHGKPFKFPK